MMVPERHALWKTFGQMSLQVVIGENKETHYSAKLERRRCKKIIRNNKKKVERKSPPVHNVSINDRDFPYGAARKTCKKKHM